MVDRPRRIFRTYQCDGKILPVGDVVANHQFAGLRRCECGLVMVSTTRCTSTIEHMALSVNKRVTELTSNPPDD
jgi:hypothetical protein